MKKKIIGAVLISGVVMGAPGLFAQQTLPGQGTSNATKPATDLPREVLPSNPGQIAPKGPDFEQKIPGQQGTIPEVIERPDGVNPQPQMVVSPNEIRRAQEALKARGYDPGAVSGNMHAGTQEALRQFQKVNNLPVTGVLDQKTGEKLGIDIRKNN